MAGDPWLYGLPTSMPFGWTVTGPPVSAGISDETGQRIAAALERLAERFSPDPDCETDSPTAGAGIFDPAKAPPVPEPAQPAPAGGRAAVIERMLASCLGFIDARVYPDLHFAAREALALPPDPPAPAPAWQDRPDRIRAIERAAERLVREHFGRGPHSVTGSEFRDLADAIAHPELPE